MITSDLISMLSLLLILGIVTNAPIMTDSTLDQAAVACLDWAWSVKHAREVAGGVIWNDEGNLTCSHLTFGTKNSVQYTMYPHWLVQFHTHVGPGEMSYQDKETVRLDPFRRPSYMREPSGTVSVYECFPGQKCRERRIERR